MKKKYIAGVLLSSFILMFNQFFIQYWLYQKHQDGKVVNLAGRQRMLSQKINLELYKLADNESHLDTLMQYFGSWKQVHHGLLEGDSALVLEPIKNAKARAQLSELTQNIAYIEKVLASKAVVFDLRLVNKNQYEFLTGMDKVAKQLAQEADRKLQFIVWMEILLAVFSILVIALEVRYIYVPIERELKTNLMKLKKQNEQLKNIAWQQSHEVRRPVANILGLIDLVKVENDTKSAEMYLGYLEQSTQELDSIIKKITKEVNEQELFSEG